MLPDDSGFLVEEPSELCVKQGARHQRANSAMIAAIRSISELCRQNNGAIQNYLSKDRAKTSAETKVPKSVPSAEIRNQGHALDKFDLRGIE